MWRTWISEIKDILSEEAKTNRTRLLATSALLALVLILGVSIKELKIFGLDISFEQRALLVALVAGNFYFNAYYSLLAAKDFSHAWDISTQGMYQSEVISPVLDHFDTALANVKDTKRLGSQGKQELLGCMLMVRDYICMASDPDQPPQLAYADDMVATVRRNNPDWTTMEADLVAFGGPPDFPGNVRLLIYRINMILSELFQVEPVIAAGIRSAFDRMVRRRGDFIHERRDLSLRTNRYSWITAYFPAIISSVLLILSVIAMMSPELVDSVLNALVPAETPAAE